MDYKTRGLLWFAAAGLVNGQFSREDGVFLQARRRAEVAVPTPPRQQMLLLPPATSTVASSFSALFAAIAPVSSTAVEAIHDDIGDRGPTADAIDVPALLQDKYPNAKTYARDYLESLTTISFTKGNPNIEEGVRYCYPQGPASFAMTKNKAFAEKAAAAMFKDGKCTVCERRHYPHKHVGTECYLSKGTKRAYRDVEQAVGLRRSGLSYWEIDGALAFLGQRVEWPSLVTQTDFFEWIGGDTYACRRCPSYSPVQMNNKTVGGIVDVIARTHADDNASDDADPRADDRSVVAFKDLLAHLTSIHHVDVTRHLLRDVAPQPFARGFVVDIDDTADQVFHFIWRFMNRAMHFAAKYEGVRNVNPAEYAHHLFAYRTWFAEFNARKTALSLAWTRDRGGPAFDRPSATVEIKMRHRTSWFDRTVATQRPQPQHVVVPPNRGPLPPPAPKKRPSVGGIDASETATKRPSVDPDAGHATRPPPTASANDPLADYMTHFPSRLDQLSLSLSGYTPVMYADGSLSTTDGAFGVRAYPPETIDGEAALMSFTRKITLRKMMKSNTLFGSCFQTSVFKLEDGNVACLSMDSTPPSESRYKLTEVHAFVSSNFRFPWQSPLETAAARPPIQFMMLFLPAYIRRALTTFEMYTRTGKGRTWTLGDIYLTRGLDVIIDSEVDSAAPDYSRVASLMGTLLTGSKKPKYSLSDRAILTTSDGALTLAAKIDMMWELNGKLLAPVNKNNPSAKLEAISAARRAMSVPLTPKHQPVFATWLRVKNTKGATLTPLYNLHNKVPDWTLRPDVMQTVRTSMRHPGADPQVRRGARGDATRGEGGEDGAYCATGGSSNDATPFVPTEVRRRVSPRGAKRAVRTETSVPVTKRRRVLRVARRQGRVEQPRYEPFTASTSTTTTAPCLYSVYTPDADDWEYVASGKSNRRVDVVRAQRKRWLARWKRLRGITSRGTRPLKYAIDPPGDDGHDDGHLCSVPEFQVSEEVSFMGAVSDAHVPAVVDFGTLPHVTSFSIYVTQQTTNGAPEAHLSSQTDIHTWTDHLSIRVDTWKAGKHSSQNDVVKVYASLMAVRESHHLIHLHTTLLPSSHRGFKNKFISLTTSAERPLSSSETRLSRQDATHLTLAVACAVCRLAEHRIYLSEIHPRHVWRDASGNFKLDYVTQYLELYHLTKRHAELVINPLRITSDLDSSHVPPGASHKAVNENVAVFALGTFLTLVTTATNDEAHPVPSFLASMTHREAALRPTVEQIRTHYGIARDDVARLVAPLANCNCPIHISIVNRRHYSNKALMKIKIS